MKKQNIQILKIVLSLACIIVGITMFYFYLQAPCNIEPTTTTQTVAGQSILATTTLGKEMNLMVCSLTSIQGFILSSLGLVFTMAGGYAFVKNITEW